jgi:thymidine kinase
MSLEIIIGPMFAGKSSALLSRIRRSKAIGKNVMIITSSLDKRYSVEPALTSHDKESVAAVAVTKLMSCLQDDDSQRSKLLDADLIVIEEAQFFPDLLQFVEVVLALDKNLVVCGLDGDIAARPFGQVLDCIPLADSVVKMTALCEMCGDGTPAIFTGQRSSAGLTAGVIHVGASETYVPLCRKHRFN